MIDLADEVDGAGIEIDGSAGSGIDSERAQRAAVDVDDAAIQHKLRRHVERGAGLNVRHRAARKGQSAQQVQRRAKLIDGDGARGGEERTDRALWHRIRIAVDIDYGGLFDAGRLAADAASLQDRHGQRTSVIRGLDSTGAVPGESDSAEHDGNDR